MKTKWLLSVGALYMFSVSGLHAQTCEKLSALNSSAVSIQMVQAVSPGSFMPSAGEKKLDHLPGFCRVSSVLRPTPDSEIHTEIWLPSSKWNGRYLAVGSGGWGGSIAYGAMADALRSGYATSATDDGHTGSSASFVVGHPEKFIDFAYRAEHEMAVEAKALIQAFYGRAPQYSYWNGCSGGGREGLLQAYRYPDEFDGIIAGDPADMRRNAWALWLATKTFKDPQDYIPPAKYPMIHRAVLAACDAKDGVKDGLIENPATCSVDFKSLECKSDDGVDCLTSRQVRTAETIISPLVDSGGKQLFPRVEPGTELRWARLAGGPEPAELFYDQFRYVVYQDAKWDWRSFNLDRDAAKANAVNKDVDTLDPYLEAFAKRGGKLLLYHGWADQQVAPGSTVEFYQAAAKVGGDRDASEWMRLFMVPGMGHCSGGEGPDTFDKINVMVEWVEQGKAPEKIVASHRTGGKVDRTRPLCPYPQVAKYKGSGSTDDAANFTCSAK
jgi:feruloyl esterase